MLDFNRAVKITQDIYWVGRHREDSVFSSNSFIIDCPTGGVLIDPGLPYMMHEIVAKIEDVTSLASIRYLIVHHQNLEVLQTLPEFLQIFSREDLVIVTHSRAKAFLHAKLLTHAYFMDAHNYLLEIAGYGRLTFITAPYAYDPLTFLTFDHVTGTLFSSDLFGTLQKKEGFYATENYFEMIKNFHQTYMPSRDILNYALNKLGTFDVKLIAPHHGLLVTQTYIAYLIEALKRLECGIFIQPQYKHELLKTAELLAMEKDLCIQNVVHFKTIIDMQDNMIAVFESGELIEANQAFLTFFGVQSIGDFKAQYATFESLFVPIDDPRYIVPAHLEPSWLEYLMAHTKSHYRAVFRSLRGEKMTFRVQVKALEMVYTPTRYVATFIDISKELTQIDILDSLASFKDINFFLYDVEHKKYRMGDSLSELLELPSVGEIGLISLDAFLQKKDQLKILKSTHKPKDNFKIELLHDNRVIYFLVHSHATIIDNRKQIMYIIVDVTMVKTIEKESKYKDTLMFQQAKMAQMGEMISMIAHQWRQPLNAISASSIRMAFLNTLGKLGMEHIEEHTGFVQKQCQKMSQVIDSFMNYSNNRKGTIDFHIRDAIDTVVDFVSAQYATHNIRITFDRNAGVEDLIFGKVDLLEQVLLNLLSNSKDAHDLQKNGKEKYVLISYGPKGTILFEDNAGGMDEATQEKLFLPYFTTKPQGKGTGLGLYMSKKILNEHFKGDMHYERVDHRSIFTITLGANDD